MRSLVYRASTPVLYAGGVFFAYPWKLACAQLLADDYEKGYAHFRVDHADATNLALHAVALVFQLVGNFGLLRELDALGDGRRWLSTTTALLWSIRLHATSAPASCAAGSASLIALAHLASPSFEPAACEFAMFGSFWLVAVWCAAVGCRVPARVVPGSAARNALTLAPFFAAWIGAWRIASSLRVPPFAAETTAVASAIVAVLCALALSNDPVVRIAIGGSVLARLGAALTGSAALHFFSFAFVAQVLQGVSHRMTNEQATLLRLQANTDKREKIQYEWSHVTYFPNLLLHSVHESLFGGASPPDKSE